jgi:precorrin-4/cobalt-precorrin-4 C11-methyltransferase
LTGATLAIHLGIHALDSIVETLIPHYGPDCPIALVMKASWPDERVLLATLATVVEKHRAAPMERTVLILVGRALAAEDFTESALYSTGYHRRFRGANDD